LSASIFLASSGVAIPNDWTFAYDNAGTLHGAVLRGEPTPNVYQVMTTAAQQTLASMPSEAKTSV